MTPRGERSARALIIECAVVATIVFAAYAASRPAAVATLGRLYDDVVYLSVGKSIADGHGYRSAQLVGTPVHVKFPPLLPAIYAVGWMMFGSLDAVARLALWLNIVVAAASAALLWWFARSVLGIRPVFAVLLVIVPVITERAMFYFSGAASEPWMLLGWVAALLIVDRLTRHEPGSPRADVTATALGFTLAATVLARTQAIAIAVAIVVALAVSRVGWRAVIVACASTVVPLVVWSVWHHAMTARGPLSPLPDQRSYMSWIPIDSIGAFARFAVTMVKTSVPLYWSNAAEVLVGWTSAKTLVLAGGFLVCGLAGTGVVARRFPALAMSIVATLGVLAIWPYVQDRFLTPALPLLGAAAGLAAERMLTRATPIFRRGATVIAGFITAALVVENGRLRVESARGSPRSPYVRAINEMVDWTERETTPNDHVMVAWGGVIYLRTGRRTSIPNPEEPTLGKSVLDAPYRFYATRLLADSVDDVIIWDGAPGRAAPFLRGLGSRCPGVLTEVVDRSRNASASDVHYYRVHRDLTCLGPLAHMDTSLGTGNKNAP